MMNKLKGINCKIVDVSCFALVVQKMNITDKNKDSREKTLTMCECLRKKGYVINKSVRGFNKINN